MFTKLNTLRLLWFIGILALISSCTPQGRLNRLIKKHPELVSSYSVVKHDTIVTQSVSTDTIFNYYTKDTVVIREGKLTMKYFYNSHDSTVYLRGECATDTIYREYVVQHNNVSSKPNMLYNNILLVIIFIALGFIVLKLTSK